MVFFMLKLTFAFYIEISSYKDVFDYFNKFNNCLHFNGFDCLNFNFADRRMVGNSFIIYANFENVFVCSFALSFLSNKILHFNCLLKIQYSDSDV